MKRCKKEVVVRTRTCRRVEMCNPSYWCWSCIDAYHKECKNICPLSKNPSQISTIGYDYAQKLTFIEHKNGNVIYTELELDKLLAILIRIVSKKQALLIINKGFYNILPKEGSLV